MPKNPPQLEWCIVRLGEDFNWWVDEISDPIHWDVDGLGIIDPRQVNHIVDLIEPLRDYGFDTNLFESAFFSFAIQGKAAEGRVRLKRSFQSILDSEDQLFILPDILDEETGPYADFLDHITKLRVKLLNDLIDFDQPLTIDELEEEIREEQNNDFMEGRAIHFFSEIVRILEYIPKGFELDIDDADKKNRNSEDVVDLDDGFDIDVDDDESIEQDETMKWDEDDDDLDEEDDLEDDDIPPPDLEDDFIRSFKDDDDEEEDDDEDQPRKSKGKSKASAPKSKAPAKKAAPKKTAAKSDSKPAKPARKSSKGKS